MLAHEKGFKLSLLLVGMKFFLNLNLNLNHFGVMVYHCPISVHYTVIKKYFGYEESQQNYYLNKGTGDVKIVVWKNLIQDTGGRRGKNEDGLVLVNSLSYIYFNRTKQSSCNC